MRDVVVDASVTGAWCFDDEESEYASGVLTSAANIQFVVPAIWPVEMVNVLLVNERKKRMLGRVHGLSAYDACYLELALRLGLPLATLDKPMRAAAQSAGVEVFGNPTK